MLCADEPIVERQVAVLSFSQGHTRLVVEVYDVFSHLCGGIIPMSHHDIGRVEQTLTVNHISLALVGDSLVDPLLAEITTEIILVVFVGGTGVMFRFGADPSL